ncbi:MAG: hypothetical protein C0507_03655 [Cyanobacteria bacterium PR.3.49]|nr:hypothetical protein [Cyanobacteria bacterium PR.3.49]
MPASLHTKNSNRDAGRHHQWCSSDDTVCVKDVAGFCELRTGDEEEWTFSIEKESFKKTLSASKKSA